MMLAYFFGYVRESLRTSRYRTSNVAMTGL